jgi:hypothetical protein
MLDEASHARSVDGDFVEFSRAGAAAKGDFHCSSCGYGISVQAELPRCPMCSGDTWEPADWSALARPQYQA